MEGDLNLSQALGGLRIANQIEDPPSQSPSPSPSPCTSPPSIDATSPHSQIYIPDLQALESSVSLTVNRYGSPIHDEIVGTSTHSLPLRSSDRPLQQQQPATLSSSSSQYQQHNFGPPQPRATYSPPSALPSSRHSSQFLQNYNGSSSPFQPLQSSNASQKYVEYCQISREPSRSSLSGPPGGPRPSQRDRSNTDRTYRQSQAAVKKGVKDFNFGRTLGEGSYSSVLAATDRTTLKEYAIKVLDKRHIIKEEKVKYVNIEKNTLNRLGEHPGVVRLYYTFQDERCLYFVLDLATGGELLGTLKRLGTFDEECTRFYAAQILDTIEYMHSRGVIHRDLKPENVLLDDKMHIKITDFGTAKILDPPKRPAQHQNGDGNSVDPLEGVADSRANSFVGTAEYVSPELLTDKSACKASDLWAFGCMIFQMISGRPPFKAGNEYQTFQKIVNLEYEFPKGFPRVAKDLVERLLVLDPAKRLSIEHTKNHEFFDGVEWGRKLWKQKAPRLKPYVPPPEETKIIKLGGDASNGGRNGGPANGRPPPPPPRVITELPPPSQLDIEWSPVLTRNNERILKLGNAVVQSSSAPHSPDGKGGVSGQETSKKFSRFFGGSSTKKRQRLVMVTSAARVIIAAAGGDDKKPKTEISLQGLGVVARKVGGDNSFMWAIDTRDKCYTFEDPKTPASEWLEQIERAREIASVSYPADDGLMSGSLSSPSSTITLDATTNGNSSRGTDSASERANKRFSKRSSRHGLAAAF